MAELHVEVKLDISSITGEEGAHGTADALIVHPDELIIVDLKYGMGVAVDAEENSQLMIYGLAALQLYELSHDIKRVRLVICQPRLHSVSEWTISVEDLRAFGTKVALAAEMTRKADAPLVPSPKGCRWCKAKATCPALREQAMADFEDVAPATADDQVLADCMSKVPMIEAWLKAIRAEVERRLLAGDKVPGYKLVQGKRGARKWSNAQEAEAVLKTMRIPHDRMYDYSLVSPTTVEKLHAEGIVGPRQWPKLQYLITQSDGSPSVAPESDKRPAITVTSASASDFDDVTALA